ncbi:MAG TPA: TetR family transcriptional regulator [Acidimicrobiia bacterium]|nr:TetR family transcriptional regulator [Acidimicrobiia bacterium]
MSETVTRKRAAKRQVILDTALSLFAERGYQSTRMVDIAEELGLQKAALYYYFDSKEAVLVELIRSRVGVALGTLNGIAAGRGPVTERIEEAVRAHLRTFHDHPDIYTVFNSEKLHTISPEAAALVDDLGRRYERLWKAMITEGIESGLLRADLDPPVTVKAILGMLNTTLTWFRPGGRLSVDDLTERFVDLTMTTLAPNHSVGRNRRAAVPATGDASGGG